MTSVAEKQQLARDRCDPDKIKHKRWREFTDRKGRARKVLQVCVRANPRRAKKHPCFVCPAGPGRRPVDAEGRWYDFTDYLRKRLRGGDVVSCAPPKTKTKDSKPAKAPKAKADGESK